MTPPIRQVLELASSYPCGAGPQFVNIRFESDTKCAILFTDTRDRVVYDMEQDICGQPLSLFLENIVLAATRLGYFAEIYGADGEVNVELIGTETSTSQL